MSVDVGSARGYLDLDISGFLNGLRTAQSEADSTSQSIANKVGANLSKMGKSITSAGTTLTKTVTVPLLGVGAAGLKVATDFEKGMSEVKAISGATGKQFDDLKDKAVELGASTAFSAGEVASAMTEMAKAGWSSQQIIDGMSGVLDAAAASGEGLAIVSTIVADTVTGFGLAAADSSKIADLLTQAANSGTIGITDLGESFKYIAPVANAMGLSVEDVTTAISAMSMAGIKGSQAGTSLRTMLTRMVKPTDAVAIAMDELDLKLTKSDGTFKSLDEIVSMMRDSFDGLTDEQKTYYATVLSGQEGMSGLLSLLNLTEEEYNAIAESMENAGGVAQETASVMQDNLQSKTEQLFGSLESLAIVLAQFLIPYIQTFVVRLTEMIEKFTALDPETQKTILKFAGLAAVTGPLLIALGKFISLIGGTVTAFTKLPGVIETAKTQFGTLKTAISGVSMTSVAIVAVIAVLIAAFVNLWKNNEEFRNNIIAIWTQIQETFNAFAQGIVDRLNALGFNFSSFSEVLKVIWQGFCDFIGPIFQYAFQLIADTFQAITNIILGILDIFIGIFTGDWNQVWEGIKLIFKSAWDWIVNTLRNFGNTILNLLNVVCGWFNTTWTDTWNSIKQFFSNTWNNIKTTASNAVSSVKSAISTGFTNAKNTVFNIFDSIKTKISGAMDSAKTAVQNGVNKLKSFLNFQWSLPKLKLPHFSISGSFSLNPPSVPKFSISWYKKAMSGGMILNSPTIFGFDPKSGQFLGGGEAGSETVVGTDSLMKMIRQSVNEAIKPMVSAVYQLAKASIELGYITHNGFAKQQQMLYESGVVKATSGGDTFNFYSPEAIDEIEAAKQMKKAKRELAEGF